VVDRNRWPSSGVTFSSPNRFTDGARYITYSNLPVLIDSGELYDAEPPGVQRLVEHGKDLRFRNMSALIKDSSPDARHQEIPWVIHHLSTSAEGGPKRPAICRDRKCHQAQYYATISKA
jgi:hypothetical protein